MIKRATAIFLILLANILLFAHVVVPHHHQKYKIDIVGFHSHEECENDNHPVKGHNHDSDNKDEHDYCILKEVIVIPSNLFKQECKCLESKCVYKDFRAYQAIWHDYKSDLQNLLDSSDIPLPPLIHSAHSYLINNSKGLRAPPVV
ncbi:MAG: hypothetical protein WC833_06160 [Bacteroidales bacterium]|jgi:hypothetical protein